MGEDKLEWKQVLSALPATVGRLHSLLWGMEVFDGGSQHLLYALGKWNPMERE